MKKKIISIGITLLFAFIYFYMMLPAINIHNIEFWIYIIMIILVYGVSDVILSVGLIRTDFRGLFRKFKIFLVVPIIIVSLVLVSIISSPIFNSKKYASRIEVDQSKSFENDTPLVDFSKLPLLDKNSSQKLGDRVMGQMSDMVSQYDVSEIYTQINYNDKIVRVTPLLYASFVKWVTNRSDGIKGYIVVDSNNGESSLVRLEKGMKYSSSAYFNENLYRKLRFSYPCENFGNISFEVDNDGKPYYIATTIKYHAVNVRAEVSGVVVLDPITGDSVKYSKDEIPSWIDIAYSPELVIEQVDDWGTYQGGYFNSIFGQKNVVNTTDGYNYLAYNDDIYLYTGLTSIVSDESNLGFILCNMRTGETSFYSAPGAEEYSAMASAEGAVQQMNYVSTFPLLINLNSKPTYLVSLKDSAGLVKMYGFVDARDYQKVVVTDASKGIEVAAKNYLGNEEVQDNNELINKDIIIKSIKEAIINGNTYYYIVSEDNKKYKININLSDSLPFVKQGSKLNVSYNVDEDIINVKKVSI